MDLVAGYRDARRDEDVARLRRALALRAMIESGMSQREIAAELGVSQSAVSQQLKVAKDLSGIDAETLLEAAAPILKRVAAAHGFTEVAVFGSVARHQARPDSDIDLLVRPPAGATIEDLTAVRLLFERIVGRSVDVVSYGGLKAGVDSDVLREAVLL
jgi:uncharacterized protein